MGYRGIMKMFWNKNKENELKIVLEAIFKEYKNDEGKDCTTIDVTKEILDGEYFFVISTLIHYASILFLENEKNPNRQDFLDLVNKIYVGAVRSYDD